MPSRIIFITGTDTSVGKTVLTGLLLAHLRQSGARALAIKPFCSGSRHDAEVLSTLQDNELSLDEVNPFYFPAPLAPLVAARQNRRPLPIKEVLNKISQVRAKCDVLLVEGAGGLFSPLGENAPRADARGAVPQSGRTPGRAEDIYNASDIIGALKCRTIIVAQNRLGTLNHVLLTAKALTPVTRPGTTKPSGKQSKTQVLDSKQVVVLMSGPGFDPSAATNVPILAELLLPIRVVSLPFLGKDASAAEALKKNAANLQKSLASILA